MRRRQGDVVSRKTFLLVEDDRDQVVLAMRALRKHGIVAEVDDVVVAQSGEEAIDHLLGEGSPGERETAPIPEFVLLDVHLPGLEVAWLSCGRQVMVRTKPRRGHMRIEVETRNVDGGVTSLGTAGQFTLVVDRPTEGGGGGLGFNGGQLLYLAVAGCISNDLFREARTAGIELGSVRVKVGGDFVGEPAVSDEILYEVEVEGDAPEERLRALVDEVDEIAEIPNSLRRGTQVRLAWSSLTGNDSGSGGDT